MKSLFKNLISFSLLALFAGGCGNKPADILIPDNAAMVFHINGASMNSKLSWDEIKNSEWFKMARKEESSGAIEKKILDDPENSGIDLKSDLYVFMEMRGNNSYVVTQGKIKDVKAYEAMVTGMGGNKEIKKEGNMSYGGDKDGLYTWTRDRFVIVGHSGGFLPGAGENKYFDNRSENTLTTDSLVKYAKDLYSLKRKKSMSKDSRFSSLLGEKGDMHFWVNYGSLVQGSLPMGIGGLINTGSIIDGMVIGYTVNFDNGKISASYKSWTNNKLGDLMKKYRPGNLNTDMLKRIPGQNPSVVFAMNYPPEGLKEFLKLLGVDGLLNIFLATIDFSMDDFVKANKGDLLLAISDISVQDKAKSEDSASIQMPFTNTEPNAKILFASSINDRTSFDKMITVIKNQINKEGGTEETNKMKYIIKDNWFIAGNSQETVDGFAAGNQTDHPFISKISGHPMGAYIDLQRILGSIKTKEAEGFDTLLSGKDNIWDNIVVYGGELKDGATIGYAEVNMVDKNTNSMKQLNNYFSLVAKKAQNTREGEKNNADQPDHNVEEVLPVSPTSPKEK